MLTKPPKVAGTHGERSSNSTSASGARSYLPEPARDTIHNENPDGDCDEHGVADSVGR